MRMIMRRRKKRRSAMSSNDSSSHQESKELEFADASAACQTNKAEGTGSLQKTQGVPGRRAWESIKETQEVWSIMDTP